MTELLTPAQLILTGLYLALDESDIEPEEVMKRAGLPVSHLDDIDGQFSAGEVKALLQATLDVTNDPALGLHIGQEIAIEMLDMVAMMAARSPTVRVAFQQVIQYSPLISTLGRAELIEEGDQAWMVLHLADELVEMGAYYCSEVVITSIFCAAQRLVKGEFLLKEVHFRLPAPPWWEEYSQVFGEEVKIYFGAAQDCVVVDRRLLDLPMKRHSPGLYRHLREQAARRLASMPQPESARASVERLIGEYLGERLLDLPTIAERMGMTPRTLQRRLKEEGHNFQSVYDACRQQQAHLHLSTYNTDIQTLAALLGYSEQANFYRAFKGWFGLTPNEYRRRYGQGQTDSGASVSD